MVVLNFANRRRLESMTQQDVATALNQLDQKVSQNLAAVHEQMLALPTIEAVGNVRKSILRKNREAIEQLAGGVKQMQKDMQQRLSAIERRNEDLNAEQLVQIAEQYKALSDALGQVTVQVHRLSNAVNAEGMDNEIAQLRADIGQLQLNLQKLSDQTRPTLTSMQDQVNHLNRQFQKLPPPFDSSALKQEVSELIKMVSDLVPKREWSALVAEVQALHRQQEMQSQVDDVMRQELRSLTAKLEHHSPAAPVDLSGIRQQLQEMEQRLDSLPPPMDVSGLSNTVDRLVKTVKTTVRDTVPRKDWTTLTTQLHNLQQQQQQQQQTAQTLREELQNLNQRLQDVPGTPQVRSHVEHMLRDQLQELGQQLHRQLRQHASRHVRPMMTLPTNGNGDHAMPIAHSDSDDAENLEPVRTQEEFQSRIESMLRQELQDINQELQALPDGADYEFVFEMEPSATSATPETPLTEPVPTEAIANNRATLEAALAQTQERLILIWPWSSQCDLDEALLGQFEAMLERGCQLDLGWCHIADRTVPRFFSAINQRWAINPLEQGSLQHTLQQFLQLKRRYHEHFQFKILGTIENFFVSDQQYAVVGINDTLITQTAFPDLELKLRTTDPEVVQRLMRRFDDNTLNPHDLDAHWNRAVTRHDLGDKAGALADFNHVLRLNPDDPLVYNFRAAVHYDLGDKAAALQDLDQALELDSHQAAVFSNRGLLKAEKGDQHGAIADYSSAVWCNPSLAIAFFYRGLSYQKIGNATAALTDYNEAIRLAPDAAIAYYHRAAISQKLGDRTTAMSDFEQASQLFEARGSHGNAQRARASLEKLRAA